MNCPYCGEDIDQHTGHCRLCGADLTLIQPLIADFQGLTQRVAALEKQAAFESEIAEESSREASGNGGDGFIPPEHLR